MNTRKTLQSTQQSEEQTHAIDVPNLPSCVTDNIPSSQTISMFAKEYKYSKSTVRRMIMNGDLECQHIPGHSIRILKHQVIKWMEK
tara:strand:- start:338 stop:595 length:258 start_codon:yes stop_codon:yes gene_type:complete